MVSVASTPVLLFLHRGEYDAVHQALSVAAAAVAMGRRVELYFFWWALERLAKDQLDEPDFARADLADLMEARGVPTIRELLAIVRESGLSTTFACSGSLASVGLTTAQVDGKVDALVGWTSILQRTAGVTDRFFF